MNQQCKVCGEPAAGFHFGAFTCEGCKSFFGRSYNNLSSISECKNNGECVINKKNRTACKACRLRKCLMVGMSKSGSRYGRRSNWFKIHCLLQEQQQAAAAAHQNGAQKQQPPALSPNTLNLMGHPAYPPGLFSRPPCTKEELMLLGLDEYTKHPTSAASPSISSPDSHNSDSSIEIGDKRNSLLNHKQNKIVPNTPPANPLLNKDLFLPLPFGGLPLMPPPGFLPPPTHLLFSSYHNALYQHHHQQMQQQQAQQQQQREQQHQGLLKAASESPAAVSSPSPHREINNHSFEHNNNHISKTNDFSKRFFLDAVLESQKKSLNISPLTTKIPKSSMSPIIPNGSQNSNEHEEDIDMDDDEEEVLTMTPPRSPRSPSSAHATVQHNPIDLSMKSSSSTKSDDINHNHYRNHINNKNYHRTSSDNSSDGHSSSQSDNESNDNKLTDNNNVDLEQKINHFKNSISSKNNLNGIESEEDNHSNNNNNDDTEYKVEIKRIKLQQQATTTPLDLTTKV